MRLACAGSNSTVAIMKRFLALLGCCFLLAPAVMAQGVSVDVVLDQDQYLAEESLTAKVRITNFSGARWT